MTPALRLSKRDGALMLNQSLRANASTFPFLAPFLDLESLLSVRGEAVDVPGQRMSDARMDGVPTHSFRQPWTAANEEKLNSISQECSTACVVPFACILRPGGCPAAAAAFLLRPACLCPSSALPDPMQAALNPPFQSRGCRCCMLLCSVPWPKVLLCCVDSHDCDVIE